MIIFFFLLKFIFELMISLVKFRLILNEKEAILNLLKIFKVGLK
jgi:hypothetical protein